MNTIKAQIHIRGQLGLALPALDSRSEPDVLGGVFGVTGRRYLDKHPSGQDTLLAIEVSDATLQTDRTAKAELYAAAGIPEYWVVESPKVFMQKHLLI